MQVARSSSPSARLTSRVKPRSENSAPGLLTVLWITSSLPRSTSTSVTAPLNTLRVEIAIKCAWLLLRAVSISASSSSRSDLRQHGRCDLDQIVECQRANGQRRRGVDRGQPVGEQRLGGGLDVMHQALEDVVEQFDLVARIIHRAVDEEIGDPAQGFDPARDGAVRERGLQFVEQAFGSGSGFELMTLSWSVRTYRPATVSSSPETEVVGSGAGDAVASPCLGCIERAVGAREKGVRRFVRLAASRRRRKSLPACRARMRSSRDRQ